jgi:hypothetical protein
MADALEFPFHVIGRDDVTVGDVKGSEFVYRTLMARAA